MTELDLRIEFKRDTGYWPGGFTGALASLQDITSNDTEYAEYIKWLEQKVIKAPEIKTTKHGPFKSIL